ncbi:MAG: PIN domain-containing protein [Ruminococcaceae bacterium]|nr:PIN domain-containing protein [Oscillospiraceae bacterium]
MKIMFDTNAFDHLLDKGGNYREFFTRTSQRFQYYVTATQIEEIAQIGDKKQEGRIQKTLCLVAMKPEIVNTDIVLGSGRLGFIQFADESDTTYEDLLTDAKTNVNDAMIGAAAKREGCTVVTDDGPFSKKLKAQSIPTMTLDEFYALATCDSAP